MAVLVAPSAALVAGVLLLLRLHFQPATVPNYAVAGDAGVRSLRRGSRFEIEATPAIEVQGAVTARAFLLRKGGGAPEPPRPWRVPLQIGRDGTVHLAGSVDALFAGVPDGAWEIVLAIGRPEMLPNDPRQILELESDGGSAAWRLVRERVTLEE